MCRKDLHHVKKSYHHTQSDPQLQGKHTTVLQGPCQLCKGLVLARAAPGMQELGRNDCSRFTGKGVVVKNPYPRKSASLLPTQC